MSKVTSRPHWKGTRCPGAALLKIEVCYTHQNARTPVVCRHSNPFLVHVPSTPTTWYAPVHTKALFTRKKLMLIISFSDAHANCVSQVKKKKDIPELLSLATGRSSVHVLRRFRCIDAYICMNMMSSLHFGSKIKEHKLVLHRTIYSECQEYTQRYILK